MSWENLQGAVALMALAALICALAGGFTVDRAALASVSTSGGIVLLFALATPLIQPGALAIGSLFVYLGAVAVVIPFAVMLSIRALLRLKAKPGGEGASLQSAQ